MASPRSLKTFLMNIRFFFMSTKFICSLKMFFILLVKYSETDFPIDYSKHYTIYEQPNQIRFDRLWSY